MIRGNRKFTTANMAIATALLCGTPAAFAQEVAAPPVVVAPPPIVQSAPAPTPAPVATPTVAPPPMVPTVSVEPAQAERPAPRRAAATKAAAQPSPRVRTVPVAATSAPTVESEANEPTVINTPVIDDTSAVTATVEDTAPVAPVDQSAPSQITDGTDDDWMIYGGLAAALGLAGLGGVLASRRRRTRVTDEPTTFVPNTAVATPDPRPLPVQQTAAPVERFRAPVAAPIARPRFADAHLPPVTDPLFAHRPVLGPITDPLFMQRTEMPPVTDPMFADKDEYVGSSSAGVAFDKRRDWQASSNDERKPLPEFEPAE